MKNNISYILLSLILGITSSSFAMDLSTSDEKAKASSSQLPAGVKIPNFSVFDVPTRTISIPSTGSPSSSVGEKKTPSSQISFTHKMQNPDGSQSIKNTYTDGKSFTFNEKTPDENHYIFGTVDVFNGSIKYNFNTKNLEGSACGSESLDFNMAYSLERPQFSAPNTPKQLQFGINVILEIMQPMFEVPLSESEAFQDRIRQLFNEHKKQ